VIETFVGVEAVGWVTSLNWVDPPSTVYRSVMGAEFEAAAVVVIVTVQVSAARTVSLQEPAADGHEMVGAGGVAKVA
jgi:hypothetical protein